MSTPFKALAPFIPRVVDILYSAFVLPCDNTDDFTDGDDQSDYWGPTDLEA